MSSPSLLAGPKLGGLGSAPKYLALRAQPGPVLTGTPLLGTPGGCSALPALPRAGAGGAAPGRRASVQVHGEELAVRSCGVGLGAGMGAETRGGSARWP